MGAIAHLRSSPWPFSECSLALSYPSLDERRIADNAQFAGKKHINIVGHRSNGLCFSAIDVQKEVEYMLSEQELKEMYWELTGN